MDYNFKKFSGINSRVGKQIISITKNNTFGLSATFIVDNNLTSYNYASLYYDSVNKAVGILFTNDENDKDKFAITKTKNTKNASLIAHSFFRKNNIASEKFTGKYIPKKMSLAEVGIKEPGAMFVIDLNVNQ